MTVSRGPFSLINHKLCTLHYVLFLAPVSLTIITALHPGVSLFSRKHIHQQKNILSHPRRVVVLKSMFHRIRGGLQQRITIALQHHSHERWICGLGSGVGVCLTLAIFH